MKSKKNSLISVSDYNLPPFQALHKRNDNWELLLKNMKKYNQIFIKIFIVTRAFYWSSVYSLFKYNSFYSKKLGIFHIPPTRTCDLNNKNDLLLLNIKIRALDEKKSSYSLSKNKLSYKLWNRAENSIAGGNMLLTKHPHRYLKNGWPTYFHKTDGCKVWDVDKRLFFDFSFWVLVQIY